MYIVFNISGKRWSSVMEALQQYKVLCTISNNIEVREEAVPWTNKMPQCAVKFEAGKKEKNCRKVCA